MHNAHTFVMFTHVDHCAEGMLLAAGKELNYYTTIWWKTEPTTKRFSTNLLETGENKTVSQSDTGNINTLELQMTQIHRSLTAWMGRGCLQLLKKMFQLLWIHDNSLNTCRKHSHSEDSRSNWVTASIKLQNSSLLSFAKNSLSSTMITYKFSQYVTIHDTVNTNAKKYFKMWNVTIMINYTCEAATCIIHSH